MVDQYRLTVLRLLHTVSKNVAEISPYRERVCGRDFNILLGFALQLLEDIIRLDEHQCL